MKKAIVTGANGFVGSAVIKELLNHNIKIIVLCRKDHTNNVPSGAKIVPFELENSLAAQHFISDTDIDIFFHFA